MIAIQALSITALEKIIIPVGAFTDRNRLAEIFESMSGFDSMRTFESFDADKGSVWKVLHDTGELILVGLGSHPDVRSVYKSLRTFSHKQQSMLASETGLFLDECLLGNGDVGAEKTSVGKAKTSVMRSMDAFTESCVSGLVAGTYRLDQRREGAKVHPMQSVTIVYNDTDDYDTQTLLSSAERGVIIADAQKTAMHLINIPSNWKNPVQFSEMIGEIAAKAAIEMELFDEVRLQQEGFHLLLGVNRGSEFPARFVVLRYDGMQGRDGVHVGLVGKGITHDTGGLSIKPSESMVWMKCDMGGAATVLAATEAAARLQLPLKLTTVIPLSDNLVDALSVKPGDILNSYNGKTVEIADTDAEGRLILADALSWMVRNTDVDHILDLATLTGAAVRALGPQAAALFCNNAQLEEVLMESGNTSGERVWPLPLWDDYDSELHSDVADLRNLNGKPTAGAIAAAKFLEVFTEDHPSWAHIDVAGTVFGDSEFGKMKSATGYGVLLLVTAMRKLTSKG
ncbi:MAG: leucyl aminopeptidase family protein [Bacteroidetes bacterium]|nr:leucyl aminopeptidase family protein [Bacteroidota bacterium]MCH8523300.1 leucyl aminopeptidase family protein [Balneolales bacterium]